MSQDSLLEGGAGEPIRESPAEFLGPGEEALLVGRDLDGRSQGLLP